MQIRPWHGAVLAMSVAPSIACADFIGVQTIDPAKAATFRLFNNHRKGGMSYRDFPDFWDGGSDDENVWLDFECEGSAVFLDFDGLTGAPGGGSIRIHGTAAVTDGSDDEIFGHVAIDVLYRNVRWNVNHLALVAASAPGADRGTFTFLETGDELDVVSSSRGRWQPVLALINPRGIGHYSGFGRLAGDSFGDDDCDDDRDSSGQGRWRFGLAAVPAPGTLALLAAAGLVGSRRRRR